MSLSAISTDRRNRPMAAVLIKITLKKDNAAKTCKKYITMYKHYFNRYIFNSL